MVEETTTSQWLYTELRDYVDRMVICDPYRNKLLNDGPKTDKIDAAKLVHLLKAGLIKEVYSGLRLACGLGSGHANLLKLID